MKQKQPTKYEDQEQLQISEFIKDPTTLKLLILAGTNIKSSELSTIAKCTNLIKLDLSSNMLSDIPISFSHFVQLKILYLHDNNIFSVIVSNSTVEYITLFNNPFKDYRKDVVKANKNLLALDYNIVTKKEKIKLSDPAPFTEVKWPIVEASASLQNQEDYLNLLKAEIFVITNLYKKASSVQQIESYLNGFKTFLNYQKMIKNMSDEMKMRKSCVLEAVNQWKNYVKKKEKLRKFLATKGKQHLLFNNLDIRKLRRSPRANQVIQNFTLSIRQRLKARKTLQPSLNSYREFLPTLKILNDIYARASGQAHIQRLYFLESEIHFLQKIFLYAKRLLFNQKEYDLCDNFEKLVQRTKREHYVFRHRQKNLGQKSFLLDSIRRTLGLVCGQKNLDRKHFLYTKKGHKKIGLKSRQKLKMTQIQKNDLNSKMTKISNKISSLYQTYDLLVCYEISNKKLFELLIKLIRYFNSGNSGLILSNQTAYFQTEVVFENEENHPKKEKMFVGLDFFVKRTFAANVIQKFWRRILARKRSPTDVIKSIREKRAKSMISNWLRYLPFYHRINMNKALSYRKTIQKSTDAYIQLDIYMKLPILKNILKIEKYHDMDHAPKEILYKSLHEKTYVEIIELCKRKWVRIIFPSNEKLLQTFKLFLFTTFKFFYNGFYLQLFNYFEAQQHDFLEKYERKVKHLFRIEVNVAEQNSQIASSLSKKLPIQNPEPFFIWAQVGEKGVQTKYEMEKKSVPISIFVYNKHQKPLKINCELNWLNPSSIYFNKKQVLKSTSFYGTSIRSRTPTKKLSISSNKDSFISGEDVAQHYITKMRSTEKRDRRNSQISPHNTLLLRNHRFKSRSGVTQNIQVDLLSQTLSIKRK